MKANKQNGTVLTETTKQLPNLFFKKSHELVFGKMNLSAVELDIMALFLSRLSKEQWKWYSDAKEQGLSAPPPNYSFNSEVLAEWFHTDKKQLYALLKKPTYRLMGNVVGVALESKQKFKYMSLFSTALYEDGCLTLTPNGDLMDVYLGVSNGYSKITHGVFRQLKSEHSKRLYSLLSRFKDSNSGRLPRQSIESLHGIFGILDEQGKIIKKSYARVDRFLDVHIVESIKDISEKDPNINFNLDESGSFGFRKIRKNRKITHIEFLFEWLSEKPTSKNALTENFSGANFEKDAAYYMELGLIIESDSLDWHKLDKYILSDLIELKKRSSNLGLSFHESPFKENFIKAVKLLEKSSCGR